MARFQITIRINQPVETVYQAYVDPDNMLKWTANLESIEVVKGRFGEPGATARLHYNKKGRKSMLEDRLEYLEPRRKIVSRVTGGGLTALVDTTFSGSVDGTDLTVTWQGAGNNIFIGLLLSLLGQKIRKQATGELQKFKILVERYGARFTFTT
jgi:uncharacterized protein YndB with AHSA1/START domain